MKRFHKMLLSIAIGGTLLISAQAAEPQDVLQTVLPAVQQEWQSTGTVSTTYFSGGRLLDAAKFAYAGKALLYSHPFDGGYLRCIHLQMRRI